MQDTVYNKRISHIRGEKVSIEDIKGILKNRRIELGLTMADVAKAVGVSEATVSRWESGNIANMKRSRIAALAKVLKISPAVIMGYESGILNYLPVDLLEHFKEQGTPELEIVKAYLEILQNKNSELETNKQQILSPEMTFGNKLNKARKIKRLTQKQLAEKIGAKHNSISDWENDKNKPDPDTIELICDALDISANYLLGTGDPQSLLSPEALEIAQAYENAPLKTKKLIKLALDLNGIKESNITSLPKEKEIPEHLETVAAHLDGDLTEEVKNFIDKF
jgi:transcriptional regulator with XRE-family HTH domain